MKKILALLLMLASSALATINRSPSGCSSHPCTYTLSCASATCSTPESLELQTALDEAFLGDTIKLTAGQTWTGASGSFEFHAGSRGGSGTLRLVTTEEASLPPVGTRITPHYASLMPVIRSQSSSNQALWFEGGTNPAANIEVRGIQIILQTGRAGPVQVGYNNASITDASKLPTNITMRHILLRYRDWVAGNNGGLMTIKANVFNLEDSYIQGAYDTVNNSEKNVAVITCLNCKFLNNAILDIAGENMIWGGTGPPFRNAVNRGEIAYNTFLNHKHRIPTLAYTANTQYSKGVVMKNNGSFFRAQASCRSTGTQGSDACNWTSISGRRHAKNIFEIKSLGGSNIHHNTFDGFWLADGGGGDQYEAVTYKISGCPLNAGSGCQAVGQYTGVVNTNGTTVTSANSATLPNIYHCVGSDSVAARNCCKQITIGGTIYQIARANYDTNGSITLTSSAGTRSNAAYSMCSGTQEPAWDRENHFEFNVIRNTAQPFQFVQADGGDANKLGHHRIANNLMYHTSCSEFAQVGYSCSSWTIGDSTLLFAQTPPGVRFINNTIVDANFPYLANFLGDYNCRGVPRGVGSCPSGQAPIAGDMIFRDNIMQKGTTNQFDSLTPGSGTNATVIPTKMFEGTITRKQWSGNIIAGAAISTYPAGTYNLCSTSAACTVNFDFDHPTDGKLFENYAALNFKVRSTHPLAKAGYGPSAVGARWDELPVITKPSNGGIGIDITKVGNTATLTWNMNAPMKGIGCSLAISNNATGWDMDNVMNFTPPLPTIVSERQRSIALTGLSNGTYYYELHCGTMEIGSFSIP